MSREQDLLFCKIAIQSGKVTQEVAQKCLALANRFEAEGKKRPQVGAILIKQNLMSTVDVQRIYGAVQKRMEAHTPSAASAATAVRRDRRIQVAPGPGGNSKSFRGPPAPGRPAAPRAVRITHKAVEEKIEPATLYLGIGMIVVLLIAVGGILFMFLGGPKKELPEVKGGLLKPPGSPPVAAPAPASLLGEKTPAKAAADAKAVLEKALRPDAGAKKEEAPKDSASPSPEKTPEPATPPSGEAKESSVKKDSPPEKGAGVE